MTETAKKMGINMSFEFDDVQTAMGYFDVSKADRNQLAWSGIGQYSDKVNPMQMAIICGAIANGGTGIAPSYIKDGTGDLLSLIGIKGNKKYDLVAPATAQKLDEVMRYTITDYYGDDLFGGLSVCAKTGTAEVGEEKLPNAWMVGYAKDADCPLAFACVVEDSGFGIEYACPVLQAAVSRSAAAVRGY